MSFREVPTCSSHMTPDFLDVNIEYEKNKNLNRNQVENLMKWVNDQPHLPNINELQAILFLHCCYYDEEKAKKTVDRFFTLKTSNPGLFKGRNPLVPPVKESLDVTLFTPLPKKTPEGYTLLLVKLLDRNPRNLDFGTQLKMFDMICMLHLHQDGTSDGHVCIIDFDGVVFGHMFRVSAFALKDMFRYVQEGIPGRVVKIHFVNVVPFMDKVLGLIKPFLKKEFVDMIQLHDNVDDLSKSVPLDLLPEDYGGSVDSVKVLHEKIKKRVKENVDFFEWEDQQNVDESLRPRQRSSWFRK